MTRRKRLRTADLVSLFDECGGACSICGASLKGKVYHIDHIIPLALGGEDERSNLQLVCVPCHSHKTGRADIPAIAKAKRLEARAKGVKRPSRNPLPGGRGSKWKKKLDGTVVPRSTGNDGNSGDQ